MANNIVDQTESVLTHFSAMLDTIDRREVCAESGLKEEMQRKNRLEALFESNARTVTQLRHELTARQTDAKREANNRLDALNEESRTLSATIDALSRGLIELKSHLRHSRVQRSALESKVVNHEMACDEELSAVESELRAIETRMAALTPSVTAIESAHQNLKRLLESNKKYESIAQQKLSQRYESFKSKCDLNLALRQQVFDTKLNLLRETNAKIERQLCLSQRLAKESEEQSKQMLEIENLLEKENEENKWLIGLLNESNGERNSEVSGEENKANVEMDL